MDKIWKVRLDKLRLAARKGGTTLYFRLYFIMKARQKRLVTLKSVCGPGDNGEPVITVMLPDED